MKKAACLAVSVLEPSGILIGALAAAPRRAQSGIRFPPRGSSPPPRFRRCLQGRRGGRAYEAFPDVCRLSDGRLMCVFYAAYDHVGLPQRALA